MESFLNAGVVVSIAPYLEPVEIAMADDYSMIDGIMNNGPKEKNPGAQ